LRFAVHTILESPRMELLRAIINRFRNASRRAIQVEPAAGYDLWAATYDNQPRNLMFHLDEMLFTGLLAQIDLRNKSVIDIGCGTGRHWEQILKQKPADLAGYDVSGEMLKRLREKYPGARAWLLRGHALKETGDASCDAIISTLVMAHIADLEGTFAEWNRILKRPGEIIITDYHPAALAKGADRTFRHDQELISIRNHVHPIEDVRQLIARLGWRELDFKELKIDETVEQFYEEQNTLDVYRRFYGVPIIYGWRLKKE
jgi:ubiquinone/menaquinone biosynthesis C-methylase UbiE